MTQVSGHQLSYFLLVTIVYPVIGHIFSCFFLIGWQSDIHSLKYNSSVKHTPSTALCLMLLLTPHFNFKFTHNSVFFTAQIRGFLLIFHK